jgi:DNA-binding transcriptional regulator YiaG
LGVSLKTIKNWEQGLRKPSKAALMLLDLELKK